jgi:G6PDH family F420-dependent oxidoreductase
MQILADGFILGLGAGENLNEHVVGRGWPSIDRRHQMLKEAIQVIRLLFGGELVTSEAQHSEVDSARLWDVPATPVPIGVAVSGGKSVETFAPLADHLIAVEPEKRLVEKWRDVRRATWLTSDYRVIGQIPIATRGGGGRPAVRGYMLRLVSVTEGPSGIR